MINHGIAARVREAKGCCTDSRPILFKIHAWRRKVIHFTNMNNFSSSFNVLERSVLPWCCVGCLTLCATDRGRGGAVGKENRSSS